MVLRSGKVEMGGTRHAWFQPRIDLTPPPVRDPRIPVTPEANPRPATAVEALFIRPLSPEPEPALPPETDGSG